MYLPLGDTHLSQEQKSDYENEQNQKNLCQFNDQLFLEEEYLEQGLSTSKIEVFNINLPTILVVEDNKGVRDFLKDIFRGSYNLFDAENGEKAFELVHSVSVDLIISDVMMPVMDGMEFCGKIKSNIKTSHIPVILLTARTAQEYQKSGYTTGADAYITKPFDAHILEVRVKHLITSRQQLVTKFKKDIILTPKELTVTSTDEFFLQKAIDIVEENMTNAVFKVQDFIDVMNMSRSALYRKLKSLTGQSITEFIRVIKLKRAAQLITSAQMTISEIAFELGFNDQKNFKKSFKQQFNQVPSKYRDNQE